MNVAKGSSEEISMEELTKQMPDVVRKCRLLVCHDSWLQTIKWRIFPKCEADFSFLCGNYFIIRKMDTWVLTARMLCVVLMLKYDCGCRCPTPLQLQTLTIFHHIKRFSVRYNSNLSCSSLAFFNIFIIQTLSMAGDDIGALRILVPWEKEG